MIKHKINSNEFFLLDYQMSGTDPLKILSHFSSTGKTGYDFFLTNNLIVKCLNEKTSSLPKHIELMKYVEKNKVDLSKQFQKLPNPYSKSKW